MWQKPLTRYICKTICAEDINFSKHLYIRPLQRYLFKARKSFTPQPTILGLFVSLVNTNWALFVIASHKIIVNHVWLYMSLTRTWKPAATICSIALTVYFLPPLPLDWYEGRTINTELRQKVLQYSVFLSHGSLTVQWFSPHHQHHLELSHLLNIPWVKSKLTLFCWAATLLIW
jgi:hypothetical protein